MLPDWQHLLGLYYPNRPRVYGSCIFCQTKQPIGSICSAFTTQTGPESMVLESFVKRSKCCPIGSICLAFTTQTGPESMVLESFVKRTNRLAGFAWPLLPKLAQSLVLESFVKRSKCCQIGSIRLTFTTQTGPIEPQFMVIDSFVKRSKCCLIGSICLAFTTPSCPESMVLESSVKPSKCCLFGSICLAFTNQTGPQSRVHEFLSNQANAARLAAFVW